MINHAFWVTGFFLRELKSFFKTLEGYARDFIFEVAVNMTGDVIEERREREEDQTRKTEISLTENGTVRNND